MDDGTGMSAPFELSCTVAPPAGAGPLNSARIVTYRPPVALPDAARRVSVDDAPASDVLNGSPTKARRHATTTRRAKPDARTANPIECFPFEVTDRVWPCLRRTISICDNQRTCGKL